MDKQKQIEEMAHNLCLKERDCEDCERNGVCLAYSTATIIYNAGYRKIPEGAVLLNKDEWGKALYNARKETAREIATRIKEKIDEISSCGLVEEYVTVINKHINDIMNEYVKEVENG